MLTWETNTSAQIEDHSPSGSEDGSISVESSEDEQDSGCEVWQNDTLYTEDDDQYNILPLLSQEVGDDATKLLNIKSDEEFVTYVHDELKQQFKDIDHSISSPNFQTLYPGCTKILLQWIMDYMTNKFKGRSWAMLEEDLARDLSNLPPASLLPHNMRALRAMIQEISLIKPLKFITCSKGNRNWKNNFYHPQKNNLCRLPPLSTFKAIYGMFSLQGATMDHGTRETSTTPKILLCLPSTWPTNY